MELASDYNLWTEYIDRGAEMTREEFDAMTVEERVDLIHRTFDEDE